MIINTYPNSAPFLGHRDNIRNLIFEQDRVNKAKFKKHFDFRFNSYNLLGFTKRKHRQTGLAPRYIGISCTMMLGYMPGMSSYDLLTPRLFPLTPKGIRPG